MTNLVDEGDGMSRVKVRNRRWWGLMAGILAVGAAGSLVFRQFWPRGIRLGEAVDPGQAIATSMFIAVFGAIAMFIYHRIIDEQEERAALWGMTVGFYTLMLGGFSWVLLASANLVALPSLIFVLLGSSLTAIAVQLWLQFR